VVLNGEIRVYNIDRGYGLVKHIAIPDRYSFTGVRGVVADAHSDRLYAAYWGDDPGRSSFLLAYDLRRDVVLWRREYEPSADSIALTVDGRKLYVPCGEEGGECDYWRVIAASDGTELTRIRMHEGAHNTIVSLDGDHAYLASLKHDRLAVVDTLRDRIVRWIGPFGGSVRPFTVNRDETLAFVTVDFLSGFAVGDLRTGRRLYRIEVRGFPLEPGDFPRLPRTQTHGIALTPDETEVWIVDDVYRHLHVFDVRGLPGSAPRQVAEIQLGDVPKWINFTRDGRFAHVSTGEIVDRSTRRVVALVEASRQYLQIDWQRGEPVRAYSRYGLGYGDRPRP
jgi:DNA-binding beta-propeller fold protein YncE